MATDTLGGNVCQLQGEYGLVSTDKDRLDLAFIHQSLSEHTYWAKGIPLESVRRSMDNSLCFGVYDGDAQVGFARVITDRATMAYLCDVFVASTHRRRGLSRLLMECIMTHPDLQNLRRWILVTADAHGLYEKFGFRPLPGPQAYMEINDSGIYERLQSTINDSPR